MFRRESQILYGLAASVFLAAAAGGCWVGHTLRKDANLIALDTLPGLVDAGSAMALTQENWLRVHLLLDQQASAAEQAAVVQQIRTNSNEGLWRDYRQTVYGSEEREEYDELLKTRINFLGLREEFFSLVQANRFAEATTFLQQKLAPAYQSYHTASQRLFERNASIGRARAAQVIHIARIAPLVLGASGLVIFGLGLLTGLRGALGGLHLASRMQKNDK